MSFQIQGHAVSTAFNFSVSQAMVNFSGGSLVQGHQLTRHLDGSSEVTLQSPVYLIGARVLKPRLDKASRFCRSGYDLFMRGVYALDRVVTRAVTFLPLASAVPTAEAEPSAATTTHAVSRQDPVVKAAVLAWRGLGADPASFGRFISESLPHQKLEMLKSEAMHHNFLRVFQAMKGLSNFIIEKGTGYQDFKKALADACLELRTLEVNVGSVLTDLKTYGIQSSYAPAHVGTYVLSFPTYVNNNIEKPAAAGEFSKDGEALPAQFADEAELRTIQDECSSNPIEMALLQSLSGIGGMLKSFNVDGNGKFTFEQFKELFGNEIVGGLEKHIEAIKIAFTEDLQKVEMILSDTKASVLGDTQRSIFIKVHFIYQQYLGILRDKNYKNYRISCREQVQNQLCIFWDITHLGTFFNSRALRFRVGNKERLSDEL